MNATTTAPIKLPTQSSPFPAPSPNQADTDQLAAELARLETTEKRERDLRREAELAAARERAKFD